MYNVYFPCFLNFDWQMWNCNIPKNSPNYWNKPCIHYITLHTKLGFNHIFCLILWEICKGFWWCSILNDVLRTLLPMKEATETSICLGLEAILHWTMHLNWRVNRLTPPTRPPINWPLQVKGQNVIPRSDDEFFCLAVGASHMKDQLAGGMTMNTHTNPNLHRRLFRSFFGSMNC